MSIETKVNDFNTLIQSSFKNAMDAVESIHQTVAEMPLDALKEFGYPEDKADVIRDSHRKILRIVYGGICDAQQQLGDLVVKQAGELSKFARDVMPSADWEKSTTAPARKKTSELKSVAQKSTEKSVEKSTKKA